MRFKFLMLFEVPESAYLMATLLSLYIFSPSVCFWNDDVVGVMIQVLGLCGALVGGHNFGFTGTEGCLVFTDGLPCNRAARAADDKTRQRAEFEHMRGKVVTTPQKGLE